MANKRIAKYPLNREKLFNILKNQNKSIKQLGQDVTFNWNEKTIRRSLIEGASLGLILSLSQYLNVDANNFVDVDLPNGVEGFENEELNALKILANLISEKYGLKIQINVIKYNK